MHSTKRASSICTLRNSASSDEGAWVDGPGIDGVGGVVDVGVVEGGVVEGGAEEEQRLHCAKAATTTGRWRYPWV
jgi:hypothetical protein